MTRDNEPKTVDEVERVNITDYVREFVIHMRKKEGRVFDMRHPGEVEYMIELINKPEYTRYKSMKALDGSYYWDRQRVTYFHSNLGRDRGYVFYFFCSNCGYRAKYLYKLSYCNPPLCRKCSFLGYKVAPRPRKFRDLSRMLRKPYISNLDKYWIIKRAGITKEDIEDVDTV